MISTISIQDTTLNTHLDSHTNDTPIWVQSLISVTCRASGLLGAFALMGLCVGAPRMGRIVVVRFERNGQGGW